MVAGFRAKWLELQTKTPTFTVEAICTRFMHFIGYTVAFGQPLTGFC